jgi:hypothetical protein
MKLGALVSVLFSIGAVLAGGREAFLLRLREETKATARYFFVEWEPS